MNNILRGPNVSLIKKDFGVHFYESLQNQEKSNVIAVNSETNQSFTVDEIETKSVKLAIALSRHVKSGDVIALLCENDALSIVTIISSIYLGTTITLLNPIYNSRELNHYFTKIQPKLIFTSKNSLGNVLESIENIKSTEEIILFDATEDGTQNFDEFISGVNDADTRNFRPNGVKDEDTPAVILSSSGTSGPPKGVKISYKNLSAQIPYLTDDDYLGVSAEEKLLILVPTFHIFGLYLTLGTMMKSGVAIFMKKFKPDRYLGTLETYKITKLPIVPPLAIFLAKSPLVDDYDTSNLSDIICGAAPISQDIMDTIRRRFKIRVRQIYGLTETGAVTVTRKSSTEKANSSGSAVPNMEIAIRDVETRTILPCGETGEICARGPGVTKGYVDGDVVNVFDGDGFFLTGDVGYRDEDGQLFIVDRIKELIKYKGFQVAPAELEGILLTHPGVKEAAVIGLPEERAGEVPAAFVVRHRNGDVTEDELKRYVADKVSAYKQLSGGVKFVEEIPKNATGKILRRILREMVSN